MSYTFLAAWFAYRLLSGFVTKKLFFSTLRQEGKLKKVKTYWTIFWRLRLMHLMLLFEYRADFFFWGFVSAMWTVFNYFFVHLLVSSSGKIGTWNESEMFVLMSVFTIFDAFTWSFFYFNMQRYTNRVFSGELDGFLVKPIDTQFLLSVEHNSYNNLFRLFIGIGVLIKSFSDLNTFPSLPTILFGSILMVGGLFLIYSVWFTIATLSFWVDRLNNINDVIPALRRLTQIPREIYSGILTFLFCGVLPLVLVTSLPAEVFLGKAQLPWLIYFMVAVFAFALISRVFFHFSLQKYSSAGS